MDFKNFLSGYSESIKKGLVVAGISIGCFAAGFLSYVALNKKELWQGEDIEKKSNMKEIDLITLEKIVRKLKNELIHRMIIIQDIMTKQNDDIKIESDNSKKGQFTQDQLLLTNQKYRYEGLLKAEITKIKECGYEPDEYYNALKKHITNEKIKPHVTILAEFKNYFDRNEKLRINFGEVISHKYLQIVSNIYYFNMKKSMKKFKDEFLNSGYEIKDSQEVASAFNDIYKSNLKQTRAEVVDYFKVSSVDTLPPKILLRVYPFYLPADHEVKLAYEKLVQSVTALTKIIQEGVVIEELYDDKHPKAINHPVDRILDFSQFLEQPASPTYIKGSTDKARILNKFDQVYGDKKNEDID